MLLLKRLEAQKNLTACYLKIRDYISGSLTYCSGTISLVVLDLFLKLLINNCCHILIGILNLLVYFKLKVTKDPPSLA